MRSIKTQYILTCAKVVGISILALMAMSISNALLHSHASDVTERQLPFTLLVNELSTEVTETFTSLNGWVLYADEAMLEARRKTWQENVFPTFRLVKDSIIESGSEIQKDQIEGLERDLSSLYTSQWWVEDAARFIGNQPSLVVYQRDLLPVYFQIQSALSGVTGNQVKGETTYALKFIVSNTHLLLAETIHQISELILTGESAYLNRFKESTQGVKDQLQLLKQQDDLTPDAANLVEWLDRQYGVYIRLANEVTQSRQAPDWNRSRYFMTHETRELTQKIKQDLSDIQMTHVGKLEQATKETEDIAYYASVLAFVLLLMAMSTSIYLTGGNARRLVSQILELQNAATDLAHGRQNKIEVVYDNELGKLATVFNQMQHIILTKRKRYFSERNRLKEIVRIITHDIKSPLINIVGHSKIVKERIIELSKNDEEVSQALPEIESSLKHTVVAASRIDELVTGILRFSSISHKDFKLEHVLLNDVTLEMLQVNSAALRDAYVAVAKMPTNIIFDLFAFKFTFSTILSNAIKYQSEERILEIEINMEKDSSEKNWLLSISDNGIGISEESEKSVFQMFAKKGERNEGFGVGLSSAKSLINRLDGDIYFKNNPNKPGVTFFVIIPIFASLNSSHIQ